ncbi:MAG TPA: PQQ-binding-like beta-propeller repeat protein [Tepidisphaeraceae bacterium]|jgi:outer membrane protein assembly factor BamB|nr:PQQ-binding-like beta-propeller repeat protein [Tepidisphaeraceae bacterium]
MKRVVPRLLIGLVLSAVGVDSMAAPPKPPRQDSALPGSAGFAPTPARPVGWRGDGTGHYPGATPPTAWERTGDASSGYVTKDIAWMTPLPSTGVSCPIIVGNRIYLTAEISDLICIDKSTGKILWIRSNPEFDAVSPAERKANPEYAEKLEPLLAELDKTNAELVEALNAKIPTAAATAFQVVGPAQRKKEIEKQIADGQKAIDKKKFDRYWGQAVFGFAGPTPTSDGKHVCAFFTTGVSVCYDLDGKKKWSALGKGGGSEHGNFASPLLIGNQFVVWANEMRGYDVETGKLLWANPAKSNNTYGSLFRLSVGNELVAGFQSGFFTRIRDGKAIWGNGIFGDTVETPIVEGSAILATVGYPRNADKLGFKAFKIPSSTDGPGPTAVYTFKTEWKDDEVPVEKGKSDFARGFVSSPLFVNGLVYRLTQAGGLIVNDANTGDIVYRKVTPLQPRTHYWDWAGCAASPTLAGKYIYLMDNQGHTVIIEPGKTYKEVAKNFLQDSKDGTEQVQNVSTPVFEGSRMYYRTPNYLYCIGG